MVAKIYQASDWKVEKVEKYFNLNIASLERLAKEFGHTAFVIDIKPIEDDCDLTITVYDDYIEQINRQTILNCLTFILYR